MSITDQSKIEQYEMLHRQDSAYGSTSLKFIEEISLMVDFLKPETILDYGCGKGSLIAELEKRNPDIQCFRYDPSIPEFRNMPVSRADMVINTDVLEHIPETDIPEVLKDISSISQNVYFNLHHGRASTRLPSGENAHCTIKTPKWYRKLLKRYFHKVDHLPGRRFNASVAITFEIPPEIRAKYLEIVRKNKVEARNSLILRYHIKRLLKDWLGVKMNK